MSTAAELAWLARLHDITEPPAPGLWPLAPGWWLVVTLLVLLLMRGGQWVWRRWRANAYRRQALRALARCDAADPATSVAACLSLLLRHASVAIARHRTASFGWSGCKPAVRRWRFRHESGSCCSKAPTAPPQRLSPDDAAVLRTYVCRWLQEHQP
ncbi:MAG: DUF4381 domain-containing protein [Novosphingobium sp.]|nr:DUF4381 domain-containing protein [Novosphingobium sp.]